MAGPQKLPLRKGRGYSKLSLCLLPLFFIREKINRGKVPGREQQRVAAASGGMQRLPPGGVKEVRVCMPRHPPDLRYIRMGTFRAEFPWTLTTKYVPRRKGFFLWNFSCLALAAPWSPAATTPVSCSVKTEVTCSWTEAAAMEYWRSSGGLASRRTKSIPFMSPTSISTTSSGYSGWCAASARISTAAPILAISLCTHTRNSWTPSAPL